MSLISKYQVIDRFKHPVILFYNGLGDHLMTLPALRALAQEFGGNATLCCLLGVEDILRGLPFNRTVHIGPGTNCWDEEDVNADTLYTQLFPCDLIICLNRRYTPSIAKLLKLLKPAVSVGFFPDFDIHIPFAQAKHSSDMAFDVARYFSPNLEFEDFTYPLELSSESSEVAKSFRSMLPDGSRCLAIHADTTQEKMWPAEKFRELLNLFLSEHSDFVVLLLGIQDLNIRGGVHARRIIPCYELRLQNTLALLRQSDIFLGIDSSLLHAADLFRIPSIGLFGPSNRTQFGFRFCHHRYVVTEFSMDQLEVYPVLTELSLHLSEMGEKEA